MAKRSPEFDSRNWGYTKLVDLVAVLGLFEVRRPNDGRTGVVDIRSKR